MFFKIFNSLISGTSLTFNLHEFTAWNRFFFYCNCCNGWFILHVSFVIINKCQTSFNCCIIYFLHVIHVLFNKVKWMSFVNFYSFAAETESIVINDNVSETDGRCYTPQPSPSPSLQTNKTRGIKKIFGK